MPHHPRGIDHLVLCVRDLEAARGFYRRLGFTLTPPAQHPFGTGNSLAQLQGNFIELLAVTDPARIAPPAPGAFSFAAFNDAFLKRREGFSMLVLQSDDARRDQADFARAGLQTYPTFDFSRQAKLPGGEEVTVAFSLSFVTDPRMPEAGLFVCQHRAPQYFWKPDYQRHDNGATAIVEVVMAAERPHDLADLFARLMGADSVSLENGTLHVAAGQGCVSVLDPAAARARFGGALAQGPASPHFIGYRVAVRDLAATRKCLDDGGVSYREAAGALQIAAADAFGTFIEFAAG